MTFAKYLLVCHKLSRFNQETPVWFTYCNEKNASSQAFACLRWYPHPFRHLRGRNQVYRSNTYLWEFLQRRFFFRILGTMRNITFLAGVAPFVSADEGVDPISALSTELVNMPRLFSHTNTIRILQGGTVYI